MKVFYWIVGCVIVLLGTLYIILFTPSGNALLKPYIEESIRKETQVKSELTVFRLTPIAFSFHLLFNGNNTIFFDGSYSILRKSIDAIYQINLEELKTLEHIFKKEIDNSLQLKGPFTAEGRVRKVKDLDFSMLSSIADGKLNATLHNDDLKAKFTNMQTIKLLDIFMYPKIFNATINGTLDYNLIREKGDVNAQLTNGKFTKNEVLDLAKKYASINMYKEDFNGDLNAKIDKKDIIATMKLKSNHSSITAKGTKLNTQTKTIDSKIDINANGNPIEVRLKGDVSEPKVLIKADELIQREATKVIVKEISKYLQNFF